MGKKKVVIPRPESPPRIVEVTWHDASLNEDETEGMAVMRTAGYFVFKGIDVESGRRVVKVSVDMDRDVPRTYNTIPQVHIIGFTIMAPEGGR